MRQAPVMRSAILAAILLTARAGVAEDTVVLVSDAPQITAVRLALGDLQQALAKKQMEMVRRDSIDPDAERQIVIGVAGEAVEVDRLLKKHVIELPQTPESLCIRRLSSASSSILLLAGRDARGLTYALLEAARAIELAPSADDVLASVPEALESPYLLHRSTTIHPCNADVERSWYYDERFWRDHFARLARCRYNNFTLTFSDQTNYLNPIYAYLVEVPGYPQVTVEGITAEVRQQNLDMLRRISQLAQDRGLDFTLGIWMQAPVPAYSGEVKVRNLPSGLAAVPYVAAGLKQVLTACPAIRGVQFRMNAEAGVAEAEQTQFYEPLFQAIRDCGRDVRLDLRYKGLRPETTQAALKTGLDVTVSTKFWAEHLGLPYHPTVADRLYRESRYSFGNMLAKPRDYRVVYRLWTAGSQRLLLWGDPVYAARFAESCRLGGGEGFEVFSPLTNKGHGDDPGDWRIFANPKDEYFKWEHERYWYFDLVFGRLGYNPQASPETWRRELHHRFGAAAGDMENAYRHASRILALVTAAKLPSASEWRWWPEMDTGGCLREYMHIQPADTAQFYAIATWKRTPGWAWEDWDETIPGYVDDAIADRVRGKTTPWQLCRELMQHVEQVENSLAAARSREVVEHGRERRATEVDLGVLAALGRYHAEKTAAATHLALFEATEDASRLPPAVKHAEAAAAAWQSIVTLTEDFYSPNLVFGIAPGSKRSRMGLHHGGHWKDRLPELLEDVSYLKELVRKQGVTASPRQSYFDEENPVPPPQVKHTKIVRVTPGQPLVFTFQVQSSQPIERVVLHYRTLDQTAEWKQREIKRRGGNEYQTTIPGEEVSSQFDLQYYLELISSDRGWLWPSRREGWPYVVVTTGAEGSR